MKSRGITRIITVHARADMMFVPDFMVLFNSSADSSLDPPPSPPGDGVLPTLNPEPESRGVSNRKLNVNSTDGC